MAISLADSEGGMLGAGSTDEDGGIDGAVWGSPSAGGDGDSVESSAMVPLLSLLYKQREKNGSEISFSKEQLSVQS